jgi:glycosyltransferase involved in cell wall biosynthesis
VISVVIPAYNEERAIKGVLTRLPKELFSHKVEPIVVVDGGEDRTEEIVRREGHLVAPHRVNRGQGDALRTGFEIALARNAAIVMTMDADGQHLPEDMNKLVRPILDDEADYVMGSRFLGEYEERGGWRQQGILLFTSLINFLGRIHITDCTNGFRAIRARGLAKLELSEDRFNAPELIMEAVRHGLRIREVPVTIKRRAAGESKKPPRLGYPLGFLSTIIRTWLR